jgi:hypothetical protein
MARLENIVHAHILHVHWDADCLVFFFVKSKGNQMERNSNQEWHVFANPHNPEICPVLALAYYIFANPDIFTEEIEEQEDGVEMETQEGDGAGCPCSHKEHFFPGGNQYGEQFMDCLHRIIETYPVELFALGILPGNLVLHLARKGASSHACSSTTILLPMVSICYGPCEGAVPSVQKGG